MAEIISNKKGKKPQPRIDLTPMVDLGFILITFFIFTSSLMRQKSMEIFMPSEIETPFPTVVPDHVAFKLFLGKDHNLYYLTGEHAMNNDAYAIQKIAGGNLHALRKALAQHKQEIRRIIESKRAGTYEGDKAVVLIKPLPNSDYGDMVNALDEMNINDIDTYALLDMDADEKRKLDFLGM